MAHTRNSCLTVSLAFSLSLFACGKAQMLPTSNQNTSRISNSEFKIQMEDGRPVFLRVGTLNLKDRATLPRTIQVSTNDLGHVTFNNCKLTLEITRAEHPRLTFLVLNSAKIIEHTSNYLEVEIPWEKVADTLNTEYAEFSNHSAYEFLNLNIWLEQSGEDRIAGIISIPLDHS